MWTASGAIITAGAHLLTDWDGTRAVAWGAITYGVVLLVRGGWQFVSPR